MYSASSVQYLYAYLVLEYLVVVLWYKYLGTSTCATWTIIQFYNVNHDPYSTLPGTRTGSSFHWFVENSKQSHTYIEHLSLVVFDDEELTDRATTKL